MIIIDNGLLFWATLYMIRKIGLKQYQTCLLSIDSIHNMQ